MKVYSDSQLIVNQVNNVYQERREKMVAYLERAKELLGSIRVVSVEVVPRSKNTHANALAKLASKRDAELLNAILVEFLATVRQK